MVSTKCMFLNFGVFFLGGGGWFSPADSHLGAPVSRTVDKSNKSIFHTAVCSFKRQMIYEVQQTVSNQKC